MKLARRTAEEGLQITPTTETPGPRPDPRDVFNRLARTVRDCFALEARLTAGKPHSTPREPQHLRTAQDPRRAFISAYLHDAIEESSLPKPTRAALHDEVEPLIDDQLAADPEITVIGGAMAAGICEHLGIPFKTSRMPDELLVLPGQTVESAHAQRLAARAAQAQLQVHDPP